MESKTQYINTDAPPTSRKRERKKGDFATSSHPVCSHTHIRPNEHRSPYHRSTKSYTTIHASTHRGPKITRRTRRTRRKRAQGVDTESAPRHALPSIPTSLSKYMYMYMFSVENSALPSSRFPATQTPACIYRQRQRRQMLEPSNGGVVTGTFSTLTRGGTRCIER